MRGWWALDILAACMASPLSNLSKEEKNAVVTIMLIGVAIYGVLILVGEAIFRRLNIRDDIDIHVGVLISISVLVAFPLARIVFARVFRTLSAAADENAKKRYLNR